MEGAKRIHQEVVGFKKIEDCDDTKHIQWIIKEADETADFIESAEEEYSLSSDSSPFSSSDSMEEQDEKSSSTASSLAASYGPLYELSELMAQLPIKRGLSRYYEGKSQSFASLASVESLEDLAKKEGPYRKRMKVCKSYGGSLNCQVLRPKAIITKIKTSSRISVLGKRASVLGITRPSFGMQRN